jgi:hypothetical protein
MQSARWVGSNEVFEIAARRAVSRRVARAAVSAVLVAATAVPALDAAPRVAHAAPAAVEALLIGDSVLNGLAQPYGAAGRAALAARHSFILDSAGCRRLITTSCRIPPGSAPTNAITVLRARAGQFDRALVVAAGYDDPPTGEFGIGAAVDVMLAEARRQGISHVIWLTYREAGGTGNAERFRQSNAVLRSRTDPELVIADWATRSAGMPSSWFSADGIHLGAQASAAMGELIGDALDGLVPARCTNGLSSGTVVPGGDVNTLPTTGGLQLLGNPVRAVDTRDLPGKLGGGRVLSVPIAGVHGVPVDATAAIVSVTAVEPCADTFLTTFPCGTALPVASMLNADALSTVANSAVVRLGDGSLCVYASQSTDVIVDVSGWIAPGGLRTTATVPVRLVDTRPGQHQTLPVTQQRLGSRQLLTVDLGPVLTADPMATAATVNVTAASPSSAGFLSVLPGPCNTAGLPPSTSSLNVTAGRNVAASATASLGDHQLCVYTSTDTDVIVDLQAMHSTSGGSITATDPKRIIDTRQSTRLVAGRVLPVELGVAAAAVVVNVTSVDPAADGHLTLFPCGSTVPTVSNVNFVAGATVANRAVVSTGGSSQVCAYSSVETDMVIDLEAVIPPS